MTIRPSLCIPRQHYRLHHYWISRSVWKEALQREQSFGG
jgi:hypothetical protein